LHPVFTSMDFATIYIYIYFFYRASSSALRPILNMEDQGSVFTSPRNRVAQLYLHAPGSLFVAFYYSQGDGGGILTRLHTGTVGFWHQLSRVWMWLDTGFGLVIGYWTLLRLYLPLLGSSFQRRTFPVLSVSLWTTNPLYIAPARTAQKCLIITCSLVSGETMCSQSCSLATAVVMSPVYTGVTWQ
jgi:hypothetical protein